MVRSGVSRVVAETPPRWRVKPHKKKTRNTPPPLLLCPSLLSPSSPPPVSLMHTNMEAWQRAGCLICAVQMGVGPLGVKRGGMV